MKTLKIRAAELIKKEGSKEGALAEVDLRIESFMVPSPHHPKGNHSPELSALRSAIESA